MNKKTIRSQKQEQDNKRKNLQTKKKTIKSEIRARK